MLFLEHNHLERRARCYKGGSSSNTQSTNQTSDNKRTVTNGTNTEVAGNNNTINFDRSDSAVLQSAAALIGDISADNTATIQDGYSLVRDLGFKTLDTTTSITGSYITAANNAVAGLQSGQDATLRTLTDAFNTAKTADAQQINDLAKTGVYLVGGVAALGLLVILTKKK